PHGLLTNRGSVHHPAPIDVLQVSFGAGANESDRRDVALSSVIEIETPAACGIQVSPTDQPAAAKSSGPRPNNVDFLANEPSRKNRLRYAARLPIRGGFGDRRRSERKTLALIKTVPGF